MTSAEIVAGRHAYAEHLGVTLGETTGRAADSDEPLTTIAAAAGNINGQGEHPIPIGSAHVEQVGSRYYVRWL